MDDAVERALREAGGAPVAGAAQRAAARAAEAAGREGLVDVAFARVDSPLGTLLVAGTATGLAMIAYEEGAWDDPLARVADAISPRVLEAPARLDDARRELDEYFEGRRRSFDLPIDWSLVRGAFTRRVLESTARIPFGESRSYGQVAAAAGSPRGFRAAGNALGSNPIPIVVPCHRVLAAGGRLGGYTGGTERKSFLLALEGAAVP
ncbi:MAG: methylated-DNA--[protein]-cysteine S-methyltransferase [Thermoleophilia bacterium]